VHVASTLTRSVGGRDEATFALGYETFFLTGQTMPDGNGGTARAGGYFDIENRPISDASDPARPQLFSDCPDGMSLLTVPGARSSRRGHRRVFAVVQFEYATSNRGGAALYGRLPSPIAVLTLDQNNRTGRLSLVGYSNVDTSAVHGLWITCGASRSPWNTHLSSEEYEPDATAGSANKQLRSFSRNLYGHPDVANPYHYGHLPEVTVRPDGTGSVRKHYCMGRISHEVVEVMPDERTVLMGDDTTHGGLFMFVADRARDLGAGTLYVARWHQKTAARGGSADLSWIRLGHARSDDVKALADRLKASDIVDVRTRDPGDPDFSRIPFAGKINWVKFAPGHETAAAFLETHRYAAFRGGSLGFTKMEGTTVNAKDKIAYSAISAVGSAMTDGSGGIAIEGPEAGMVYAWPLRGEQRDDTGAAIDSEWVPVSGAPVPALIGEDLATPDALGNLSNPDKVANPDNLKFSEKMRTLFIGEDSWRHVNNFLWAYHVDTGVLSRILSTPAGAESTGLHAVDDVNGFSYIMSNFQHPGDWVVGRDADGNLRGLHARVRSTLDPLVSANYNGRLSAAVGYLTLQSKIDE
ncbi:MAG: alkaline phosphatase PhoX, partial [Burkholderiaceae bacterium]